MSKRNGGEHLQTTTATLIKGSGFRVQGSGFRVQRKMVLPQNHFVQNELPQFVFIECSIVGIHHLSL